MPLFEFVCTSCGHKWERLTPTFRHLPLYVTCPNCPTGNGERVPSVSAFALKGAGFHINDYKKD
jgi:putative FmdB family regulatory protein